MVRYRTKVEGAPILKEQRHISLIGPGCVGKSVTGAALAECLARPLIDLDRVFCECVFAIGPYIKRHGYEAYVIENAKLAEYMLVQAAEPVVFVCSSGFLASDTADSLRRKNQTLLRANARTVLLLPCSDLSEATHIIQKRQSERPYGQHPSRAAEVYQKRVPEYLAFGADLTLYANGRLPETLARQIVSSLNAYA